MELTLYREFLISYGKFLAALLWEVSFCIRDFLIGLVYGTGGQRNLQMKDIGYTAELVVFKGEFA